MGTATINIPPGVVSEPSKLKNEVNWREVNLVRWSNGKMVPVGPFEMVDYTDPTTAIRAVHSWRDNSGNIWKAYLTEDNAYVEFGGNLVSINPVVPLVAYDSDFTSGGYGDGLYGAGTYGTARPDRADRKRYGPAFTLDNWGQNLIIMSSADGRLLEWVPPTLAGPVPKAAAVAGAPVNNYTFVVTPERHIIVYQQAGNYNEYAWCDKEDNTDWNFADVASEAGFLPVEPSSPIVVAKNVGDAGIIFWSLKRVYVTRYLGVPYIYNHDEIAEGTLPLSAQSVARANENAIWQSESGFWLYNGVSIVPLSCDIWDWVTKNINIEYARQFASCVHVMAKTEIWFFFPSGEGRNDRVAIYNYRDKWWSQARISRSAGFGDDMLDNPIMANGVDVFKHESGSAYAGASEGPWAETFTLNYSNGSNYSVLRQLLPEVVGQSNRLSFQLITGNSRSPSEEVVSPKRKIQPNGYVDFMFAARDFRIRVSADDLNAADWSLEKTLVDIVPKGAKK